MEIVSAVLTMMTPILIAGLGGLMTELGGVLNIALEGLMLMGAFFGLVIAGTSGSLLLGLLGAAFSAGCLALLMAFVSIKLKANLFICGLATNLLGIGLTTILSAHIFGTKGVLRFTGTPALPRLAGGLSPLVYGSWVFLIVLFIILYYTPAGLRVRAAGLDPLTLRSRGVPPDRIRMAVIIFSGIVCGIAGAALSLRLGAYVPNITAGRGWIALVAIYLGGKHPVGIFFAALLFAAAGYASNTAQGALNIPSTIILGFPFFITLMVMVATSIYKTYKARI